MGDVHIVRRRALAAALQESGIDAALITRLVNVRYLTGLASSNAALLVWADGSATLATDGRYAGTAAAVCPDLETVIDRRTALVLAERAAAAPAQVLLGFEDHHVTVRQHGDLTAVGDTLTLTSLDQAVERLRTVKDETELDLLRRACAITDAAFEAVLPRIRPGMTERELAVALERQMVDLGAEAPAFDSIVAAGPNGAVPHHRPGDRPIAEGDLVTMDFGARCDGYHADMTRTVAVGRVADWQRETYELVAAAQQAAVQAAVDGAETRAVDAAARDLIREAGHGDHFPHGVGHGVGLEIHEAPLMGYDKTGRLSDRATITAEPGVYLAERGGVRIEDTLAVRADGPEILTKTTKDLLVV
ncbi:M24 family metallopeptidase [Thermomonospora cellulosilytica]|uniref:Xaa-Pro aminopeptidase n=1 Tax=Thermomonospora cellulosilytica TaxID=1411118 RepID=A0A7W3N2T2_9ACTN|nr:Xaa-Pro peptidase family protein [Thermomonospora cellulosilytica]MBA9006518.1 Xaa-Pro aminopeptidase [Thermomonospora cellulosilytica]